MSQHDYDDTETMEDEDSLGPDIIDRSSDPVDVQIAAVMLSASELAHHTPLTELMPQIEGGLGALWTQAEAAGDQNALAHIQTAWENVQLVTQQARGNAETLAASIAALGVVKKQRDEAHQTIGDLSMQVEELTTDLATVEDYAYENFMEGVYSNGGHIFEFPGEEIAEALLQIPGVQEDELPDERLCGELFKAICSADDLTETEGRELIAFIKDWGGRVRERRDAKRRAIIVSLEAAS
jgi:hypothetical protein